jgi:hypothetical protein
VIDPNISETEKLCIRILAKLFEEGETFLQAPLGMLQERGLKVESSEYDSLMRMMETYGAIRDPINTFEGGFWGFTITPNSVLIAREIDELERKAKEPEDIVGQVNQQVRKHPVAAWIVIGFVVLAAVLTVISQVLNILNTLGWLPVKHP